MKGFLGPYSMTQGRIGHELGSRHNAARGVFGKVGEWTTMWHGYLNLVYDQQGGSRGGNKTFVNAWSWEWRSGRSATVRLRPGDAVA